MSRPTQAEQHLCAAWRMAHRTGDHGTALQSLPAMALLLLDGESRLEQPDIERAVELYALASRYPYVANSRWFEDVAGREIAAAEALPPDLVAAARGRGRARDLWATLEGLLDEFAE